MTRKAFFSIKAVALLCVVTLFISIILVDLVKIKETVAAQLGLPEPTEIIKLSKEYYDPVLLGLKINPQNPFDIEYLIDAGDSNTVSDSDAARLINYFLTGLSVPEEQLWVNLSPYEKERVLEDGLESTELGRDLLKQDYLLKQLTSSLSHPDNDLGKNYWETLNRDMSDLGKVWIKPNQAEIYEEGNTAIISKASLKVEAESDNNVVFLPALECELNHGQHFTGFRQIYQSLILAKWFKTKYIDTVYASYLNNGNLSGFGVSDPTIKEKVWKLYCRSFDKGVYDLIRESSSESKEKVQDRRYFSGGAKYIISLNSSSVNSFDQIEPRGDLYTVKGTDITGIPDYSFLNKSVHTLDFHTVFAESADQVWNFLGIEDSKLNIAKYTQQYQSNIIFGSTKHVITMKNGMQTEFYTRRADKLRDVVVLDAKISDAMPDFKVIDIAGVKQIVEKAAEGKNLRKKRKLTDNDLMVIGYSLGKLHREGIIHGDLAYRENLFIDDNEKLRPAFFDHIYLNYDYINRRDRAQFIDRGSMKTAEADEIEQEMTDLRNILGNSFSRSKNAKAIFDSGYDAAMKWEQSPEELGSDPFWLNAVRIFGGATGAIFMLLSPLLFHFTQFIIPHITSLPMPKGEYDFYKTYGKNSDKVLSLIAPTFKGKREVLFAYSKLASVQSKRLWEHTITFSNREHVKFYAYRNAPWLFRHKAMFFVQDLLGRNGYGPKVLRVKLKGADAVLVQNVEGTLIGDAIIDEDTAIKYADALGRALGFLHVNKIVHNDLDSGLREDIGGRANAGLYEHAFVGLDEKVKFIDFDRMHYGASKKELDLERLRVLSLVVGLAYGKVDAKTNVVSDAFTVAYNEARENEDNRESFSKNSYFAHRVVKFITEIPFMASLAVLSLACGMSASMIYQVYSLVRTTYKLFKPKKSKKDRAVESEVEFEASAETQNKSSSDSKKGGADFADIEVKTKGQMSDLDTDLNNSSIDAYKSIGLSFKIHKISKVQSIYAFGAV